MRGMGRVTRRSNKVVEPWSYESAFADLRRTITFPPEALQAFGRNHSQGKVRSIRKRAWMALPNSNALLDIDIGLQIDLKGMHGIDYPRATGFDWDAMVDMIAGGAALHVRVRSHEASQPLTLLKSGKSLASRYASQTSPHRAGDSLVKSGIMAVVVEAPGLTSAFPNSENARMLCDGRIQLRTLDADVPGGGKMKIHFLSDENGTKGDRKRIRELRVHILRLHSIFELMRMLASSSLDTSQLPFEENEGTPGFNRLQRTLLESMRVVERGIGTNYSLPSPLLDSAFFLNDFAGTNLDGTLGRLLTKMRPKVRNSVEAAFAHDREYASRNLAFGKEAFLESNLSINNYYMNGSVVGDSYEVKGDVNGVLGKNAKFEGTSFGRSARVTRSQISGTNFNIDIGGRDFPQEELIADIRALREHLIETGDDSNKEAGDLLREAELEIQHGRSVGARKALKRFGEMALDMAGQIGAGLAQAAIQVSMAA